MVFEKLTSLNRALIINGFLKYSRTWNISKQNNAYETMRQVPCKTFCQQTWAFLRRHSARNAGYKRNPKLRRKFPVASR